PSVEIQHGSQGRLHWAYSSWLRIPTEGYEVLPDVFWAWSEADAAEIDRWAGATSAHRALAAGNPWFVKSLELAGAEQASPAAPAVLVTLQTGLSGEAALEPILRSAAESPASWAWTARLHPTMRADEADAVRALLARRAPQVALHTPESESIFADLARSSVHVTISSSTVLEAAAMGVRSVLLDPAAEGWFPDLAARGMCTSATEAGAMSAAIAAAHETRARPEVAVPPAAGLAHVLGAGG
ncbi:MAG: hypothetical protein H0V29_11055, partial [Thermoleophilaceae bacterium]|nr:hypothetical protein [Thermoleophilaceae bacterium]